MGAMDGFAVALTIVLVLAAVGALGFAVWKYGIAGVYAAVRSVPGRLLACLTSLVRRSSFASSVGSGGGGRRARRGGTKPEDFTFARFTDSSHKFSLSYPQGWQVMRSDNANASILVQIICDAEEESYKRVSVSWDDVSWSNITAATFAQNMLTLLPPGSTVQSHGAYNPGGRSDGAYSIVYRFTDAFDSSESQILNVVIVSTHGGRRRAYTVTFGTDAAAYGSLERLARHIVDSFHIDEAGSTPARADSDEDGTVHIDVWERERARMLGVAASTAAPAAPAVTTYGPVVQTPSLAAEVTWVTASVISAGLTYAHPALWSSSGLGHDESLGFAPVATHSVRRWCIAYTCDRRESCYKHMSLVCVDITPCYELVASRAAKNPTALQGTNAGTLLLTYVLYRYRCELLEAEAAAAGRPPSVVPLLPAEEMLRPYVEAFSQRWPLPCRLSSPLSQANSAADVLPPTQTSITDQRVRGNSRLLKVAGGLRSGAVPAPTTPAHASSPRHHGSTYSSLSLDTDNMHPEGQLILTTSAVVFGLHDAVVDVAATARARGAKAAAGTSAQRFFAHVVTFTAATDAYSKYEQLAQYIFHNLEAQPAAAPSAASAAAGRTR